MQPLPVPFFPSLFSEGSAIPSGFSHHLHASGPYLSSLQFCTLSALGTYKSTTDIYQASMASFPTSVFPHPIFWDLWGHRPSPSSSPWHRPFSAHARIRMSLLAMPSAWSSLLFHPSRIPLLDRFSLNFFRHVTSWLQHFSEFLLLTQSRLNSFV